MRSLLSERFAPITSAIGFLELELDVATAGLATWRRELHGDVAVSRPEDGFPAVLHRLEPLTGGTRARELLVAHRGWTAYFDCLLNGTDAVSAIGHLSRVLGCRGVALRCVPHVPSPPDGRRPRYGAVQFELFGPEPTEFMNQVRSVSASFDTSWVFTATGTPQSFEDLDAYTARRVRDRFDSAALERCCAALGIEPFDATAYGPSAALVESPIAVGPGALTLSLQEAQDRAGIVPGQVDELAG